MSKKTWFYTTVGKQQLFFETYLSKNGNRLFKIYPRYKLNYLQVLKIREKYRIWYNGYTITVETDNMSKFLKEFEKFFR